MQDNFLATRGEFAVVHRPEYGVQHPGYISTITTSYVIYIGGMVFADSMRRLTFAWRRRNIAERDLDLARRRLPGDGEPDRPGSVIDQRDRGRPSFEKHSSTE